MISRKVVGITGGIGAGKSMVCNILSLLGYPVYDCDSRAKLIMDEDISIKKALVHHVTPDAVDSHGNIDRKAISEVVFKNHIKLKELNSIVHGAVREDIKKWLENNDGISFVETAILYESGVDKMVDEVWEVTAPDDVRIERVCRRNNLSIEDVISRIESQKNSAYVRHEKIKLIVNDYHHSLLLQINECLE